MPGEWAPSGEKLRSRTAFSAYFNGRPLKSKRCARFVVR
jgi:hypothetical protein